MRFFNLFKRDREVRETFVTMGLVMLAILFSATMAMSQTRPTQSPVYQPNGILAQKSFTAPGTYVYTVNGDGAVSVEVTGTGSGITAEFDISGDRSASPTWGSQGPITANGTYRFDVAGYAQVRFNLTALTSGTVTVAMSGGPVQRSLKNGDMGAIFSNTMTNLPATISSQVFINNEGNGVVCTFNETSSSGSPTTSFNIQEYDSASQTFLTLLNSGTITGGGGTFNGLPTVLMLYPGMQTTSLPTQTTAISMHLPYLWRLQEVLGGTLGPGQISTVGCQSLK